MPMRIKHDANTHAELVRNTRLVYNGALADQRSIGCGNGNYHVRVVSPLIVTEQGVAINLSDPVLGGIAARLPSGDGAFVSNAGVRAFTAGQNGQVLGFTTVGGYAFYSIFSGTGALTVVSGVPTTKTGSNGQVLQVLGDGSYDFGFNRWAAP
jgi:hypothetical protein